MALCVLLIPCGWDIKLITLQYCYANEDEVGEGLKAAFDAGVKREDIFITTKLWCTYHRKIEEGLEKSLKSLGVDYVDLFLMHWPVPMNPYGKTANVKLRLNEQEKLWATTVNQGAN
jgi:diketogulonate reductase-like aldo/keto reductase